MEDKEVYTEQEIELAKIIEDVIHAGLQVNYGKSLTYQDIARGLLDNGVVVKKRK